MVVCAEQHLCKASALLTAGSGTSWIHRSSPTPIKARPYPLFELCSRCVFRSFWRVWLSWTWNLYCGVVRGKSGDVGWFVITVGYKKENSTVTFIMAKRKFPTFLKLYSLYYSCIKFYWVLLLSLSSFLVLRMQLFCWWRPFLSPQDSGGLISSHSHWI